MATRPHKSDNRVADISNHSMQQQDFIAIEIPEVEGYYDSIANEWIEAISGYESINNHTRERRIEKVPPLILRTSKRDYYEPLVVALGPYHHESPKLQEAERCKLTTLQLYVSSTGESVEYFFNKVLEVIGDARKCYLEDSVDIYDDKKFAEMMVLDGCFILYFIECLTHRRKNAMLFNEHLGALGFASVVRDIFLLENQLPYIVLKVLMSLKFDDGGEEMLKTFFNYLNFGELFLRGLTVIPGEDDKQPLHLLEIYRASFLSMSRPGPGFGSGSGSGSRSASGSRSGSIGRPLRNVKWEELKRNYDRHDELNYMKKNRSFPSVTELKAKGIRFSPRHNESSTDIRFNSRCWYGELELPRRVISSNSKAILLNMIAYEMSPRNPNDFRVATYIKFMKTLIVHRDDVKELRSKRILIHSLSSDEEVAKMFEEIDTPGVNVFMFNRLKRKIEKHCNSLTKTWLGELNSLYFSSPWRTFALLGALSLLCLSFLQTFFTIDPLPDKSMEKIISILQNSTIIK